jgi:hypothetical protein
MCILVNAQDSSQPSLVSAGNIKSLIHDFVAIYFRCLECRGHFLFAYDHCYFHHCTLLPVIPPTVSSNTNNPSSSMNAALPTVSATMVIDSLQQHGQEYRQLQVI